MIIIHLQYMSNIQKSIEYINHTYDKLSYFDVYGGSVFVCVVLISLLVIYYYRGKADMALLPLKDNWAVHRCNPLVMPFAGYIVKPEGIPWLNFTANNFNYCTNNILQNIVSSFFKPIQMVLLPLLGLWKMIMNTMQAMRKMFYYIRKQFTSIYANILNRLFSVVIVFQKMGIALRDMFAKIRGVLITSFYTFLGVYASLKLALGVVMELAIIFLVVLSVTIIGLWFTPWTWGIAAALTAMFVALSIPLIYIIAFMDKIMHTRPSRGVPGKPSCFDENTIIKLKERDSDGNRMNVYIKEIELGDKLANGGVVTGIFKVHYNGQRIGVLDNVIVTGDHYVRYDNNWIHSCEHPEYMPFSDYDAEYLYCLNVSTKCIKINNMVFSDWDDMTTTNEVYMYNKKYSELEDIVSSVNEIEMHEPINIHRFFDGGFSKNTKIFTANHGYKNISSISIGDELDLGNFVTGIVIVDSSDLEQYEYVLKKEYRDTKSSTGIFNLLHEVIVKSTSNIVYEKGSVRSRTDKVSTLEECIERRKCNNPEKVMFHLLTSSGKFIIDDTIIYDYNSCLDHFT